jgi:hypothetical protein
MAIFRQYLAGQTLGRQSDAAALPVSQTDSDLATYEDDSWIQDWGPGWKTATPRLNKLTYDINNQLRMRWFFSPEFEEQLLGLCKSQGIE